MSIEPVIVAVFAGLSTALLWLNRAMPWRLRLSLMIPRLYFALLYLIPMPIEQRSIFVRGGLIVLFLTEAVVSSLSTWHRRRSIWNLPPKI